MTAAKERWVLKIFSLSCCDKVADALCDRFFLRRAALGRGVSRAWYAQGAYLLNLGIPQEDAFFDDKVCAFWFVSHSFVRIDGCGYKNM